MEPITAVVAVALLAAALGGKKKKRKRAPDEIHDNPVYPDPPGPDPTGTGEYEEGSDYPYPWVLGDQIPAAAPGLVIDRLVFNPDCASFAYTGSPTAPHFEVIRGSETFTVPVDLGGWNARVTNIYWAIRNQQGTPELSDFDVEAIAAAVLAADSPDCPWPPGPDAPALQDAVFDWVADQVAWYYNTVEVGGSSGEAGLLGG